jgi:hypothetical protein
MTTLVESVKARIEASVAALNGATEEVADLAELVKRSALPQRATAAFVIPLGFNGGIPDAATGIFRQLIDDQVGVVLVVQAPGDPQAKTALAKIDVLSKAVINAVAGWAPDDVIGVFRAVRGRLVSIAAGTVFFQIDFAVEDQLRIAI